MNTQSHMLMGAVLFGKPLSKLAWAGVVGGILPDLPMYLIIAGLRFQGYTLGRIFGEFYWEPWWQIANATGHNFFLWGALALFSGFVLAKSGFCRSYETGRAASLIFAVSASALVHSIVDFLVHRDDAHMHFWPFTEWRFHSPVSYWDPNYYGQYFGIFEATLGVFMAIILFRRYTNIVLRIALGTAMALYVAVPAFFYLFHHG